MQGGQGWNRDVLNLPGCEAELSPAGVLVWYGKPKAWGVHLATRQCSAYATLLRPHTH